MREEVERREEWIEVSMQGLRKWMGTLGMSGKGMRNVRRWTGRGKNGKSK